MVAPYLKTAAVNLSAGYYNEHRPHECIDMLAVENNIRRVAQMAMTETESFPYMKRRNGFFQYSLFGGQRTMFDCEEEKSVRRKLLMEIPVTARLLTNGYEIIPESTYLIDREGNVYIYLAELNAAVESEHSYVCDEEGEPIAFSPFDARRLPVLSMEAALEQLSMM